MKEDKIFLDTNVIVYAYDAFAGKNHETAMKIMEGLWRSGLGIVSTQVLQEFFVVVTSKRNNLLDTRTAKEIVSDLLKWNIIVNDGNSILDAIEIQQKHKYSFWDSMIIESAIRGGASILLSEDLSDGQIIEGLKIKNPFLGH
ncbi:MAG: PIN domain-containing protein [Nitrospirae bacterium]|nr:PIN domain-containing protein [Nitrospirota bacterium]